MLRNPIAPFAAFLLLMWGSAAASQSTHDRRFWLSLKTAEFHVARCEAVFPLAREATQLLASTDSELRDGIAYEALARWVYTDQCLDGVQRDRLVSELTSNARRQLGEDEGDALFGRSFSALALSLFAAADLKRPTLSGAQIASLVDLGTELLARERDLRGYVPAKGWGHATAHAADLLKFLARNARLTVPQQRQIVGAIGERLRSAGRVFVWGEDARLAGTLASVARRADVDAAAFNDWFKQLAADNAALWGGAFDPAHYIAVRAQLNALNALQAELDTSPTSGSTLVIQDGLRALHSATD